MTIGFRSRACCRTRSFCWINRQPEEQLNDSWSNSFRFSPCQWHCRITQRHLQCKLRNSQNANHKSLATTQGSPKRKWTHRPQGHIAAQCRIALICCLLDLHFYNSQKSQCPPFMHAACRITTFSNESHQLHPSIRSGKHGAPCAKGSISPKRMALGGFGLSRFFQSLGRMLKKVEDISRLVERSQTCVSVFFL